MSAPTNLVKLEEQLRLWAADMHGDSPRMLNEAADVIRAYRNLDVAFRAVCAQVVAEKGGDA